MRILREWIQRLWGALRPGRRDADLEQELRLHLELAAEDARRRGGTGDDAVRAARIEAGGASQGLASRLERIASARSIVTEGDRVLTAVWQAGMDSHRH